MSLIMTSGAKSYYMFGEGGSKITNLKMLNLESELKKYRINSMYSNDSDT